MMNDTGQQIILLIVVFVGVGTWLHGWVFPLIKMNSKYIRDIEDEVKEINKKIKQLEQQNDD